ncbi:hypothetical protein M9458_054357, partial [Cirrhinus mrigala]
SVRQPPARSCGLPFSRQTRAFANQRAPRLSAQLCRGSPWANRDLKKCKFLTAVEGIFPGMSLRPCASGCGSFLASLDGHDHCLTCLGREHAEAAFTDGSCVHCERMTMAALKSRRSFASRLPSLSSRGKSLSRQGFSAAAVRHLGDMQVTMQNAPPASKASASPRGPVECSKQFASPHAGPSVSFGAPQEVEMSATASEGESEDEADVSAGRRPSAVAAPSEADAALSAMLLRAAKEIGLEVPKTSPADPSRLDDWFLGRSPAAPPRSPPVPFFPEVHEELARTWRTPFSSRSSSSPLATLDGGAARGHVAVPQVERAVAVHRDHLAGSAPSPLQGVAYHATGQAATALHAMATLQVYQAQALKHLHEGGPDQGAMQELRAATDFALRATKVMARSLGQVMSTVVVQERHLWLTLAQMAAPISQGGLFSDTVEDFAQQFSAFRKQTEALKHIFPRRDSATTSAGPQPPPARCRGRPPAAPKTPAPSPAEPRLAARRRAGRPRLRDRPGTPSGQPRGGGDCSLGDDNIYVPTPRGGPGAAVRDFTERVNFLASGVPTPSYLLERRLASSDPDSEIDIASAGTREEGKRCPVQSDFSPGRSSFWDQSPSPSSRDEVRILQSLLHRAQKERWAKTHPGSSSSESVPSQAAVQNAQDEAHANMHPSPGLVCSHRPEGRILSRLDSTSTQTLPTVCFRGSSVSVQSASIWPVPLSPCLYKNHGSCLIPPLADGHSHSRRLASHSSLARFVVRTQGPGAPAPQPSGPSGQPGEEQTLPSAEDLFSRCGAGLGQHDSPPHQRARAVSAELSELIQTQDSGPSQNISEAPGAYGSCSRGDAAGLASYETASALVTRSSPEMGMAPWHTPDWRFPAVSPPVQPVVSRHLVVYMDASSTGWGAVCNGQAASGSWTGPRLQWHINCLELLAVLHALRRFRPMLRHKHVLVRTDSAATVAYINHQGGLRSRRMSQLARHLLLWSQKWLKSLRAFQIPGELNRAADQLLRQSTHPGEWRLHPQRGSPRQGCAGTQLASGAQVRLSPSEPPCTDTVQDQGGRGAGSAGCAILAHPDLVSRPHFPCGSPSLEDPLEERPSFSGDGHNLAPASRPMEPARLAPGRDASDLSGLSQAVIDTITQSRAPSTRQAYALRWGLFVDWCSSRGEDPQRCPIAVVLSFLQEKLERRLSPSTLKVYVAAIAAYHDAVDGASLGKHQLIVRFLRGARRVNPPRPHLVPSWDLSVTLQGLREAPFEPLASVELKHLSLKTALLTALASIKRVVNLQALPLEEEADPASALLCPVRALRIYVDRTRHFRRTEQLFVCFGGQQKGNAVSKQRLAHWVVDAISLSYQNQGEPCPLGVHAHSTRSVASSYALAHGASLADICRAAGWATPNTFTRFYNLRVEAVSSHRLVSACCATPNGSVRYIPQLFPPVNLGPSCGVVPDCAPAGSPSPSRCSVPPPTPASVTTGIPVGLRSYPSADTSACQHVGLCVTRRQGRGLFHGETTEGERLGYVRNPRSLKEGTETLHPLPRPYVALTPGCDSAPQRKPE